MDIKTLALAFLTVALTACGGGSGGNDSSPSNTQLSESNQKTVKTLNDDIIFSHKGFYNLKASALNGQITIDNNQTIGTLLSLIHI